MFAVFCYAVLGFSGAAHAEAMLLPGTLDVTANGAASYSVPISVPPGTAGMAPSLSLDYSSQGGSGLVGVGWSLSGLPSIGRCPRTMAQDSVRGSVNYDLNDRFCMEGQRLVLISGTYGAAGSEYRTEIEGFSKITASGTAGNGPASFTVKTKSGQVMEFGNTVDSRILAQGKTTARSWAVNKISDTKGNYLTITYTNDTTNGQAYPTRIDYTGNANASLTPYNSVQFAYATRPDIVPLYHAGSLQKTTVRLTDVKTYQGANLVSDYKLAYDASPATGRSRLTSIKLCSDAAGMTCLPATTFAYSATATYANGGADGLTVYTNAGTQNATLSGYQPSLGDFNGDGKTDILWDRTDTSGRTTGSRVLWLSTTANAFTVISNVNTLNGVWGTGVGTSTFRRTLGDFNGDGKTDILWTQVDIYDISNSSASGSVVLWLSNVDGTFQVISKTAPAPIIWGYLLYMTDVNGDGRSDLLWNGAYTTGNGSYSDGGVNYIWQATDNGDFQSITTPPGLFAGFSNSTTMTVMPLAGNFNEDGIEDTVFFRTQPNGNPNTFASVHLENGDGSYVLMTASGLTADGIINPSCQGILPNVNTNTYKTYYSDFNGDGKVDPFWLSSGNNREIWLTTAGYADSDTGAKVGTCGISGDVSFFVIPNVNNADGQLAGHIQVFADLNGDSLSDILWFNKTTHARTLWLGKGDGSFSSYANVAAQDAVNVGDTPLIGDFNGDGKPDILWDQEDAYGRSNGTRKLWLSDGIPSDLLTSFTTGLGLATTVQYKPLTDSAVYAKDTDATYPVVDVTGASYVVYRVNAANGIGGTYSSTYGYKGGKSDLNGRGFLGFRQRTIADQQTNVVQTTNYNQSFPKIGLVASETKALGAQTLNSIVNTYTATPLGGTRNFVGLTGSVASSWDTDGTAIPAVTTGYAYDAYGNATQISVSTPDGASKVTTNTYTNNATNWFLGRLTAASVTSTVP